MHTEDDSAARFARAVMMPPQDVVLRVERLGGFDALTPEGVAQLAGFYGVEESVLLTRVREVRQIQESGELKRLQQDRPAPKTWAVYKYEEFEPHTEEGKAKLLQLAATPCGKRAKLYVLCCEMGGFRTQEDAEAHLETYSDTSGLVVLPFTGPFATHERSTP